MLTFEFCQAIKFVSQDWFRYGAGTVQEQVG